MIVLDGARGYRFCLVTAARTFFIADLMEWMEWMCGSWVAEQPGSSLIMVLHLTPKLISLRGNFNRVNTLRGLTGIGAPSHPVSRRHGNIYVYLSISPYFNMYIHIYVSILA